MARNAASAKALSSPHSTLEKMPLTLSIVIGVAGLFLFLSSQIVVATGAAVWAVDAYFHLGTTGLLVLGGLAAIPVGYACWKILVMAIAAERDPANN